MQQGVLANVTIKQLYTVARTQIDYLAQDVMNVNQC